MFKKTANTITESDPRRVNGLWRSVRSWRRGPYTFYTGYGNTPREAYRNAYREQRLDRHDVATLLRERAGLRWMLAQAERKIASDAARLSMARRTIAQLQKTVAEQFERIDELKNTQDAV